MKKLTKIMGLLAVLTMLVGLLPMASATPASAVIGTLQFGTVTGPTGQTGFIANTTEIIGFDQSSDGTFLWADATAAANNTALKRGGAATNWVSIGDYLVAAGAARPFEFVAAAPDDPGFFAVVTNGRTAVYVTMDKGATWSNTNVPTGAAIVPVGALITGLAVSAKYPVAGGDARDIAFCTALPAAAGSIYVLQLKPFGVSGWIQSTTAPAQSFRAVKFAPAYAGDFTIVTVGATAADTFLSIGVRDINATTGATIVNWAAFTGYPVAIEAVVGASPGWANLITADIAIPADFQGQVDRMRRVYATYDDNLFSGVADVYRIDNIRAYRLSAPEARPFALAYSGTFNAGKLLMTAVSAASANATVPVWRSLNPQSSAATWDLPYKSPTGAFNIGAREARARAMWSTDGKTAYLGSNSTAAVTTTALYVVANPWGAAQGDDESGWSVSRDDSDTWNGYSGLNTTVRGFTDIAVAADSKTIYAASVNDPLNMDSIFRSKNPAVGSTTWERVLIFNATMPILRMPPDKNDGTVIFWGDGNGLQTLQRSVDSGQTWANTLPGFAIQDFAAADQNTLYVLNAAGRVRKGTSTGPGWLWAADIDPRIGSGNRIAAVGNNVVIGPGAGGTTFVAYSTDGGASYPRIMYNPAGVANTLIAPGLDPDFANNKVIDIVNRVAGAAPAGLAVLDTVTLPVSLPALTAGVYFIPVGPVTVVQGGVTFTSLGGVTITVPATTTAWTAGTAKVLAATEVPGTALAGFFNVTGATGGLWRWAIGKNTNAWDALGFANDGRTDIEYAKSGELFTARVTTGAGVDRSINALDAHPKPGVEWDQLNTGLAGVIIGGPIGGFAVSGKSPEVVIWAVGSDRGIYAFIDNLTDVSPAIQSPKAAAGADAAVLPVAFTGFAQPFGIHWNLPSPQTQQYQVQLSASDDFSDVVATQPAAAGPPWYTPTNTSDPSWFIANPQATGVMGGNSYWTRVRVRTVDTGQNIMSEWSKPLKMVVQSGVPVQAPYSAPQPTSPTEGVKLEMPASVGFTWTPMPGATEYKFVLATDAALVKTVVSTAVTSTAYSYDTALKEGVYFWQVTQTKPVAGTPSPVSSFTVVAKPAPAPTPVINVPTPSVIVQPPPAAATPAWVWVVIAIGAILVVVTIVLIFRTRKV